MLASAQTEQIERTGHHAELASGGRRMLVAEDTPVTQHSLKLILTQRGFKVDTVGDGALALEALRRHAYDVAILDFHLPVINGLQVVSSYLLANNCGKRPRFVAFTADIEGLLARGNDCELFDYIVPKSLNYFEISALIEEYSGRERAREPRNGSVQ